MKGQKKEIDIEVIDYGIKEIDEIINKEFVDNLAERAEKHLERDGFLDPAFFVYTKNKKLLQLIPVINNRENLKGVVATIESIYADCNALCTIHDVYVISIGEDEDTEYEDSKYINPSTIDYENEGQTCILIQLQVRDGRFWIRQRAYQTIQDGDTKYITFDADIIEGSHKDKHTELIHNVIDPWKESGPAPVR